MSFDASNLIQSTIDQQMSTERPLVPEGEYVAVSDEVKSDQFRIMTSDKFKPNENGCDAQGKRLVLDLPWIVDDAAVVEATHRTKNFVRQSIFIDVTPGSDLEAGRFSLALGENWNIGLGALRKALGQNETGRAWSFSMLGGKAARISVKHRMDGDRTYDGVSKVVAL